MPSSQTSVLYNVDGNAIPRPALYTNQPYIWTISVIDQYGNIYRTTSGFTTGP
jgi:hypothetical protein